MTRPEQAAKDVAALYERHAAGWDEDRRIARPHGEAAWISRFAAAAGPARHVLDLGCGSGEPIARDLVAAGLRVTGVDASRSLIALCASRFPDQEWIVGDMRALSLDCRFGGLVAWHSLFHLEPDDQQLMFGIIARHLVPGAPLMFTSGPARNIAIGAWRGEALYHASLAPSEYECLLLANGFTDIEHAADDPSCGGATIWMARLKQV